MNTIKKPTKTINLLDWEVFEDINEVPKTSGFGGCGYVYALEYGNAIKIGCTAQPKTRIKSLMSQAQNYSGEVSRYIALSVSHCNFRANERTLHKHFSQFRKPGTELFNIGIGDFLETIPDLEFSYKTENELRKEMKESPFYKFIFGLPN